MFGSCPFILAGDWNQKLDLQSETVVVSNEICLRKLIQDFDLCDFFMVSEHDISKNDRMRLTRQGQIPCMNTLGNTFFPKIVNHQPSRIDGVFISRSLINNMTQRNTFLSNELPAADHKTLHIAFTWSLIGLSAGGEKPKFFFRNHLLNDKTFMRKMRGSIAQTLIKKYKQLEGSLSENVIKEIKIQDLENILFDRIKNQGQEFSAVDVIYQIFEEIEKLQNFYLK